MPQGCFLGQGLVKEPMNLVGDLGWLGVFIPLGLDVLHLELSFFGPIGPIVDE